MEIKGAISNDIKVKSLAKSLEILNCFIDKEECGITEIAEKLKLNKSNVHNIVITFRAMGYLEQNSDNGKYRLGLRIMELNRALGDRFTIQKVAQPFLQEISNTTKERVYMAVPKEGTVLYLSASYPTDDYSMARSLLGVRAEMHCTGLGKAMLAFLPEGEVAEYLQKPLGSYTENTITNAIALKKELEITKLRGFAIDDMEHEFGVKCIAMPIFYHNKEVAGAISISGPSLRFSADAIEAYAKILKSHIKRIEERIS